MKNRRSFLTWLFSDFTMLKAILMTLVFGSIAWGPIVLITERYERADLPDFTRIEVWAAILSFLLLMFLLVDWIRSRNKPNSNTNS